MTAAGGQPDAALARLGFDERWQALYAELPAGSQPWRVIRDGGSGVVAAGSAGERRLPVPSGLQPVTGDWIAVRDDRILAIAQRISAVVRPRADGRPQVLAANIDLVGVVHALDRPLNRRRLERGLVLAWESGASPVVVLTKADGATDPDSAAAQAAAGSGADVVVTSAVDGRGLAALRQLIAPARTLVLLGASGAGKSSLANALLGAAAMPTAAVRAGDGKGRHKTSHRQLLVVPSGGLLLDTPGLRALVIGAAEQGLSRAFPDIEALARGCRFGDCRHDSEPGCAVLAALDAGELGADRLEGWRRVRREADSARVRADPVALRERNRQWGRMAREVQAHKHPR